MSVDAKVRENRLRRTAERRRYRLEKSRRRDTKAVDFGGFMLIDNERNFAILGGQPHVYGASIDDIAGYLMQEERDEALADFRRSGAALKASLSKMDSPSDVVAKLTEALTEAESQYRAKQAALVKHGGRR